MLTRHTSYFQHSYLTHFCYKPLNKLQFHLFISGQCSHFIPLKTPENFRFSGVFRGYKIGNLTRKGLTLADQRSNFRFNVKIQSQEKKYCSMS